MFVSFIVKSGSLHKAYKALKDKSEWIGKLNNQQGIAKLRRPDIINAATQFYKKTTL